MTRETDERETAQRDAGTDGQADDSQPGVPRTPGLVPEPMQVEPRRATDRRTVEGTVLRAALVVLGVLAVLALLWAARSQVILALVALVIATGMYGPAERLERRGLPRVWSVLAILGGVLGVTVIALLIALPPLVAQGVSLVDELPSRIDSISQRVRDWLNSIAGAGTGEQLLNAAKQFSPDIGGLWRVPLTVVTVIADLVLVVFIAVLMLLERDAARGYTFRFVSPERRDALDALLPTMLESLGGYVRAQLAIMAVTGATTGIGMVLLGVPFPLPMALLAFLTEAIPLVGPWIAGVPVTLLALSVSPLTGLVMVGWMIGVQALESYVLVPTIQGRVMNLSPLVVLLAVLAGASLSGIVGALLAVPLVALGHVVVEAVIVPLFRRRYRHSEGAAET